MSLDSLKALIAATGLLAVLGACDAGAETAQAGMREPAAQDDLASPLALSFDELPEAEREARMRLGEELLYLVMSTNITEIVRESLMESTLATIRMNYPDITEDELAEAEELIPGATDQHEGLAHQRMVATYASAFTINELTELTAFFNSDTGLKFNAVAGEIHSGVNRSILDTVGVIHNDVMRIVRPESFGMEPRQRAETPEGETVIDLNAAPDETPEASTDSEE